jgi:hypothetical protein
VYTVGTGEKMSADYEAVLKVAAPAGRIKVARAGMASADLTIFEFSTHVDTQRKQIGARPGPPGWATTQSERKPGRNAW